MQYKKKRGSTKKLVIAIALVAILAVAIAATVYVVARKSSASGGIVGVKVGDTFTYSITGSSSGPVSNLDYPGFYQLNDTQYYNVTVTGIQGDSVTLKTDWVFVNGTDISQQQTIDLSNGVMSDENGFSFLYPSNLKVNDPIYPKMNYTVPVNATLTQSYDSGARDTVYYWASTTEAYQLDPTQSTERYLYDQVWFDRQTGMLTSFSEIQEYNNPALELEVIYTLTYSTVWNV
ncbi:MAG: hypothetical protein ABSG33_11765 [Candidatus Bathyarchaeia archaeon]|jgi:hypothetical protein